MTSPPPQILNDLRDAVKDRLDSMRRAVEMQEMQLGWPTNVSNGFVGLPIGFPRKPFSFLQDISWMAQGILRHDVVCFSHVLSNDNPPWAPLVWTVTSLHLYPYAYLGEVEIDARIIYDPNPLIDVSASFILKIMSTSISLNQLLRVVKVIIPAESTLDEPNLQWSLESLEVQAAITPTSSRQIEIFPSKRYIPRRYCSIPGCTSLLPLSGPPLCDPHIRVT